MARGSAHRQFVDGWGIAWPAPRPPSLPAALVQILARMLAGWVVELAFLLAPVAVVLVARPAHLTWLAVAAVLLLVALLAGVPVLRRPALRLLHGRWARRRWARAVRIAAIPTYGGHVPGVVRVHRVPAGDQLAVRVPLGGTVRDLKDAAEVLAVVLEVRDVTVTRDADNARKAIVGIIRRDALAVPAPIWPNLAATRLSVWEPIPVGVDHAGGQVTVSLPGRNVLFGGEPGGGKSAALSLLVATAALDPTVRLHLFDGKLVELATWAGVADHAVGVSTGEANDVLRELQHAMDDRYVTLLANRARKVTRDSDLPLHLLVIDELAHYLLAPDRKERVEFAELLRDLVARGRAAGLIVLAATQKPSHDVIPTALRDLFGFRWALRCNTPQASDTVLGAGWSSQGYSAADVDSALRGVGYLLHEGGLPVRLRCHYLDDSNLAALADRAEQLRGPRGAFTGSSVQHECEMHAEEAHEETP